MEIRSIEQVKLYGLIMNDMRSSNIEIVSVALIAYSLQELEDFYKSQKVETYKDENWTKCFKKDGPLEWKNPVYSLDQYATVSFAGDGLTEEWINQTDLLSLINSNEIFFIGEN